MILNTTLDFGEVEGMGPSVNHMIRATGSVPRLHMHAQRPQLVWHLRKALAPLTFIDEHPATRDNPVAPALRSVSAKAATKHNTFDEKVRGFRELLDHLGRIHPPHHGAHHRPSQFLRAARDSHPHPAPNLRTTRRTGASSIDVDSTP